jgi:nucleoside-diphosphate-sugar epimerase
MIRWLMMTSATGVDRVLVTGGTGYLAGWVILGLLERGYLVRTTARDAAKAARVRDEVAAHVGPEIAETLEIVSADLLADAGWAEAMADVANVIHTASPMPFDAKADLVTTAREGTLRVLRAASTAGVGRVVLTSSGVAVASSDGSAPADETTWAEPSSDPTQAYPNSKILAEHAAWDEAKTLGLGLVTVLPTFMQGPAIGRPERTGTIDVIRRLLLGALPALPKLGWNIVDVRDIAELHILAMTAPDVEGQRILGSGTFLWYRDIALKLKEALPDDTSKVPTRTLPNIAVRLAARFNPQLAMIVHELGQRREVSNTKARQQLGWDPRHVDTTIVDTARFLLTDESLA